MSCCFQVYKLTLSTSKKKFKSLLKATESKIVSTGLQLTDGRNRKGLAKLGNFVVETLLHAQMFPSLATQETLLRMQILRP